MRLDRIAAGDIVKVAIKGRTGIYGEVTEVKDGVVHFRPISTTAGWRHASAHEVVGHWRKAGRRSGGDEEPPPKEQLSLPLHS